ncbi:hypothetical protein [Coxiella-like endosymbiont of Rhipicephalus sanguineus]|uniref:hypothetical protein n=1 Tax=Coxiella-like endosymbiont of Rhipicephalus sanguineus TaxID=1955402 RepID=UPI00203F400D|nr:hypothetical protein [Coxiella-like endosymbiont of Rhipicephalus sanguineus]
MAEAQTIFEILFSDVANFALMVVDTEMIDFHYLSQNRLIQNTAIQNTAFSNHI